MSDLHSWEFTDDSELVEDKEDLSVLKVSPSIYYPTLNCQSRTIIHQGGTSSGKTVNILAVLATRAKVERKRIITVTSESLPHLKGGAMRDFSTHIAPKFAPDIVKHNKTDNYYLFRSGSIIEFKSFEDEQSARGSRRHYLYINEGNIFPYLLYYQLNRRTKFQTIIDYNPSIAFWAHEKLIGNNGVQLMISDHRSNPFLTLEQHREIEMELDPELWRVYARGLTGNLKGLIYTNWTKIPDDQFPHDDESFFGGLDFGYTNDPTAGVKIVRRGDDIFVHEMFYSPGIATKEIKEKLYHYGFNRNKPIYCDHDKEMIAHLRRNDDSRPVLAYEAKKSINAGIIMLKKFNVFYTASSIHIDDERKKYMWLLDPNSGAATNTPIDKHNHLMDAIRYGVYTHYFTAK